LLARWIIPRVQESPESDSLGVVHRAAFSEQELFSEVYFVMELTGPTRELREALNVMNLVRWHRFHHECTRLLDVVRMVLVRHGFLWHLHPWVVQSLLA